MCARAESGMAIKAAVASLTQAIATTCNDVPASRLRDGTASIPPSRLREGSGVGTARQRSNCSNQAK